MLIRCLGDPGAHFLATRGFVGLDFAGVGESATRGVEMVVVEELSEPLVRNAVAAPNSTKASTSAGNRVWHDERRPGTLGGCRQRTRCAG